MLIKIDNTPVSGLKSLILNSYKLWLALLLLSFSAQILHAENETPDLSIPIPESTKPLISDQNTPIASPQQAVKVFNIDKTSPVSEAITTLIAGKRNHLLSQPDFSGLAENLSSLYQKNNNQLLWLGESRSQTTIDQVLNILLNAPADGLDPLNYDTAGLKTGMQQALTLSASATPELAKFDTALSIALMRFISDLHHGRVIPQQLNYPTPFGNKQSLDMAEQIKLAIDQRTLAELPQRVHPKLKQYRQLKQVLASYRQSPQQTAFLELVFDKTLRPGDSHPQLLELQNRLTALGVLSADTDKMETHPPKTYNKYLQEGVKAFQKQNGLQADAYIGTETAAKLNQSLDQKILQIELAMERLRWVPDDISGPMIIVNIPAFQLWAFKSADDPDILNMKVIVGKALKNQTPVLFEEMKYLEFMPYWNIPKSIMTKEILPKLGSDYGYLQSQNIELVRLDASSSNSLYDDIRHGRVRARQRPGKKNPLGKVKFIFPNTEDVYLHDTSSPGLFRKTQRDLSHGCVRVSEAEKLAEWVLTNQPETSWDLSMIQNAMSGDKTRRVNLKKPIPVLFFYSTAFVDPDNQIHFYRDIYQQDAVLEKALGKTSSDENGVLTAQANASG